MRSCVLATMLAILGCVQMLADVVAWPQVKAVAAATQVSPAMKVFTSHEGYETFSPRFSIRYTSFAGQAITLDLTPEIYGRLQGPYNRRNAYGAALAYAPVLSADDRTRGMLDSIMRYAFCEPGTLLRELALDDLDRSMPVTLEIAPRRPLQPARQLRFEVSCHAD